MKFHVKKLFSAKFILSDRRIHLSLILNQHLYIFHVNLQHYLGRNHLILRLGKSVTLCIWTRLQGQHYFVLSPSIYASGARTRSLSRSVNKYVEILEILVLGQEINRQIRELSNKWWSYIWRRNSQKIKTKKTKQKNIFYWSSMVLQPSVHPEDTVLLDYPYFSREDWPRDPWPAGPEAFSTTHRVCIYF